MEGKLTHLQSATSDAGAINLLRQQNRAISPAALAAGYAALACSRSLTHRDVIRADALDFLLLFAVRRPAICSGGACLLPTQHGCL